MRAPGGRGLWRRLSAPRVLAALAAVLFAALFWRALFLGEVFVSRDLGRFYWPSRALILPLVRAAGGVPLWNPLFNSGQPFAANPHFELFHPLTLLFLLLPFDWAFRLQVLLPPVGAAISMAFLLRTLGRSRGAAAFGALAWAIGGAMLSSTNMLPALHGYAPVPAFAAFLVRLLATGSPRALAGAALMLGLSGLSGELSALYACAAVAAAAVLQAGPAVGAAAALRRTAASLLLGGAIAAAALLPGYTLGRRSARAHGIPPELAQEWSSPPARPAELLFPRLLGHAESSDERLYWGSELFTHRYPFVFSIYAGLPVLLLAAVAVAAGRRRVALVWCGLMILGFALAAGSHLPFFALARRVLPFLSSVRFPERFLLLAVLPLPVLAAEGWDLVLRRDDRRALLRRLALVAACLSLAGALIAWASFASGRSPVFWMTILPELPAEVLAGTVVRDFLRQAVLAGVLFLLAARLSRRAFALSLLGLTALDLATANRGLLPTAPPARLGTPPRFLAAAFRPPLPGALFHAADWQTDRPKPAELAPPPIPAQWGLPLVLERDYDMGALAVTHEAIERYWEAVRSEPALGYPLLLRRGVAGVARFKAGTSTPELVLLKGARPFAFCAERAEAVTGGAAWVAATHRLKSSTVSAALVETRDTLPGEPSPCSVAPLEVSAGHVRLDVTSQGPAPSFLALNQTWDTGWSATVDGAPAPLLRTDVSLSGLLLPPGRHAVALRYRDPWVYTGLALSLAGLAVAALVFSRRSGP